MNKLFFSLIAIILCLTACNSAERKAQKVVEKCEPGLVWVYYSARYAYHSYLPYFKHIIVYYNPKTKEISEDKSKVSPLTNSGIGCFITDQSDILTAYDVDSIQKNLDEKDFQMELIKYFVEKSLKYNDRDAAEQLDWLLRNELKWTYSSTGFQFGKFIDIDFETQIAYNTKSIDQLDSLPSAEKKSSILIYGILSAGEILKVDKEFPNNAYTFPFAYQNKEEAKNDLETEGSEENKENKRTFYILGYEPVNLQNGKGELRTRYISVSNPQIATKRLGLMLTDTINGQWHGSPIVNEEGKLVGIVNHDCCYLLTAEDFKKED